MPPEEEVMDYHMHLGPSITIYLLCTEFKHECVCMYKLDKLNIKSFKLEEVTISVGNEFQSRIEAGRKE